MQIIRLRVHDKIYKNLMWFLERFKKEELQIINESKEYLSVKEYLTQELNIMEEGKAEFIDIDELEEDLENTIEKYED